MTDLRERLEDDRPREACGIFGVYAPGEDVASITYFGLYALQHRGQESAGIATGDGQVIRVHRGMGLVSQVCSQSVVEGLRGTLAIGHCRYATTGDSTPRNAQPMVVKDREGLPFALAHNGNLVNAEEVAAALCEDGVHFSSSSDSEVILQLIARTPGANWQARVAAALPRLRGAFSLTMASSDEIFAARDPWGIRPLCLGLMGPHWVVASESCALDAIGAHLVRELAPGELVRIGANGLTSVQYAPAQSHLCSFEFIYFARPDSIIEGQRVHSARISLGKLLAREHPADADLVIPVPDSAVPMAVGYARESGIPYGEGLVKNRYIGRTFIAPTQRQRDSGIQIKFNPLTDELVGRRLVVIEDSIVRGTTSRPLVALLRRAGAREIHMRIASPPYRYPCHLGLDTGRSDELLAARADEAEMCRFIGADSLGFLSIEGLIEGIGRPAGTSCRGCLTGRYPVAATAVEPAGEPELVSALPVERRMS